MLNQDTDVGRVFTSQLSSVMAKSLDRIRMMLGFLLAVPLACALVVYRIHRHQVLRTQARQLALHLLRNDMTECPWLRLKATVWLYIARGLPVGRRKRPRRLPSRRPARPTLLHSGVY
jgi:hypothetical protein